MILISIFFALGVLFTQTFKILPPLTIAIFIIAIVVYYKKYPLGTKLLLAFFLGFIWSLWFATEKLSWELPQKSEGKLLTITGKIVSLPAVNDHRLSFLFAPDNTTKNIFFKPLFKLSWQKDFPKLIVGDQWQLKVKLKRVHSTFNPGGFDYEAFALQQGIRAQGYVVSKEKNFLLASHWYSHPIDRVRQHIQDKINQYLPVSNTSPWISALILGERHDISPDKWEVLRNTGTNHLMAIAGLHIGFLAGFAYLLVSFLWRRIPKAALYFPAQQVAGIASLLTALIYSVLAGFALPTQRACIMLSVFLLTTLAKRKIIAWHAWSMALLLVLLLNPLSVLSASFWLSFGSVALIIYGVSGRLAPHNFWWKWGRTQWVVAIGLVPISLALFQQFSLVSFAANSIAIPWVGFLLVPLCFVGAFCVLINGTLGGYVLLLADKLLNVLWIILAWFSHWHFSAWYQIVPSYTVIIIACIGMVILLVPIGFPGRYFGLVGLLPLIFYHYPQPRFGTVDFTLLDVGQGLSAVVQTEHHVLVFDTGAKLSDSYDMGANVVVPFLRSQGIKTVDLLVVSHQDNDHIGGSSAILKQLSVKEIKSSVPERFHHARVNYCLRGDHWQWDGVQFEFLHPDKDMLHLGNNSSCVLKISTKNKSVLLTGDIEKAAEKNIVQYAANKLSANIIVAPHHGSKTSGEKQFLQAVHPQFVLYPIGYRNRYHFPHASIVHEYQLLQANAYGSAHDGAVQFVLSQENESLVPKLYRVEYSKYWN